jgi:hypothetical protein
MEVRVRRLMPAIAAMALAVALLPRAADATVKTGVTTVKWYSQARVNVTLTPNYYPGYGSVKATFGAQPAPTTGPDSAAGAVDFGPVLSGAQYIYKYAVHVNVQTTSSAGFDLYGEGAADFYNQADGSSQTLSSTLFYVPSTSGSPADSNTGFSPGYPFYRTAGMVTGGSFSVPPTIAYTTYPAPIASTSAENQDFYYDYELKVPPAATAGAYFVWVVYTVMAQ